MNLLVTKLDNGLRFASKQINSRVAYCSISINSGTKNENPKYNGIAHFTEHMIFKGTSNRSAFAINSTLEKLGGELNAYTTKEETVIHATVLKEDLPKGVEILLDLAFNALFPESEVVKEREIILDEIGSYKDTPSELIFDDFEFHLFKDHPLSMPILGSKKTIDKIDTGKLFEFYKEFYTTDQMSLTVFSNYDPNWVLKMVQDKIKRVQNIRLSSGIKVNKTKDLSIGVEQYDRKLITCNKHTHQSHILVGTRGYSVYDEKRYSLSLLSNILGGPAQNSRLNLLLREKHGIAYNVETSYTPFKEIGVFNIYFGTDKKNIERALELIEKEQMLIINKKMSTLKLNEAKRQLIGQITIAADNMEVQCLNAGKSLLIYDEIITIQDVIEKIKNIEPDEFYSIASEVLNPNNQLILIYK